MKDGKAQIFPKSILRMDVQGVGKVNSVLGITIIGEDDLEFASIDFLPRVVIEDK